MYHVTGSDRGRDRDGDKDVRDDAVGTLCEGEATGASVHGVDQIEQPFVVAVGAELQYAPPEKVEVYAEEVDRGGVGEGKHLMRGEELERVAEDVFDGDEARPHEESRALQRRLPLRRRVVTQLVLRHLERVAVLRHVRAHLAAEVVRVWG